MQLLAVTSVGRLTQSSRSASRALNFVLCVRERLDIKNDMFIMQNLFCTDNCCFFLVMATLGKIFVTSLACSLNKYKFFSHRQKLTRSREIQCHAEILLASNFDVWNSLRVT